MKAKLVGKQYLDFATEDGGRITGTKLHVVSTREENDNGMKGYRVADIFTKLDVSAIPINSIIELVYEQTLGSSKSRLVAIELAK